ncbi:DUF2378 family protein [Hyalangium minutum]|uniref:Myxococcales-restricted protein, TIGR02265 family n=1 Tax=Hyalangium minutum TaxID=394096 RepID=A0A085W5E0_9BACT|nr:DUF2378 family protein [Hyalangium minutum]KFE62903.1 hypothetical protein DB31_2962 [Hyalangium minutum]
MDGRDTTELSLRLQRVLPVHTVRGLAFNSILSLVSERAGEESAARLSQELGLLRLVDFFSYPASDFTRLLFAATSVLAPSLGSEQEALRACGAACLHQFFYGSTVGRALAKIMGRKNPQRGFANTSIAYATMVNYGTHECEVLGERKLRIVFRGDVQPALFHEGTLAAALEVCGVQGTVQTTIHGLDHAEFLLEWGE